MAELSRKELRSKINKKELYNFYLIYGEEKMYVKTDTKLLVEKLMGKNPPEFNFHKFEKDYELDDIAVATQVAPFMSEYNVVLISDLDVNDNKTFPKSDYDRLISILDNTPDTTIVIFTMPTLKQDMKKLGSVFTNFKKYIGKRGAVCAASQETNISLARQIIKWADTRGIKIEQADAYKLQEYAGFDLNTIKNELDKLCNYVGDKGIIETEDIEKLVTKRLEANIFALTDAIVSGNSDKAFNILETLFYQKAEPNEIINVISMSYLDYYRARVAFESGTPIAQTAKYFGYGRREFALKNAGGKTRKMSTEALRESVFEITETTAKLRSVSANGRIMVEKLVAALLILAQKR
ncbi:MAG: DNA polymerase III subunit delta [Ruminococcus sp.]|jgi:DNA polymerase-3 subunit delta|nr:DNA polymerase III subunit delta [Ruminococcus sp.]